VDASPFLFSDATPGFPALRAAVQARSAATPTALAQARLPVVPACDGAFDRAVAAALRGGPHGQRAVYPAILGGVEGRGATNGNGVEGGSPPARGQE
jgi:hypothetical protein